jgi:hypothetical protein
LPEGAQFLGKDRADVTGLLGHQTPKGLDDRRRDLLGLVMG